MSYFDDNEARFTGIPRYVERAYCEQQQKSKPKQGKGARMANEIVKFESATGQEVTFTADDVRHRICPNLDDKELAFVMALCQSQRLNPFTKDVYITKFGDKPAQIVTGKEVFTKRAQANPRFDGMEAGITVMREGCSEPIRRDGSLVMPGETLIGGWSKVYVKGYRVPIFDEVSFAEYAGRKRDGSLNSMWASKGATMIRKVALCHALREAFPDEFQGLYGEEEMGKAGEVIAENQNHPSESTTAPKIGISDVVTEADFVEMMSDDQQREIDTLVTQFSELCGKEIEDVLDALFAAKSVAASGAVDMSTMTSDQAAIAIGVLTSWVEKSRAAHEVAEELRGDDLAEEDIDF